MIVSELLYQALRLAGVVQAAGRTAATSEMSDALVTANALLDAWAADGLLVYAIERSSSLSLSANTASYTIGSGGAFNMTRPLKIDSASCIVGSPAIEVPVKVLTSAEWNAIEHKSETSNFGPRKIFYQTSFPLGTIYLHPIPSGTLALYLFTWAQLTQFAAQGTTLALPPAYLHALKYNIAVELAHLGHFVGFKLDPDVRRIAEDAKNDIRRLNAQVLFGVNGPVGPAEKAA